MKRFFCSLGHAFRGIAWTLASEPNARIQLLILILVVGLGAFLGLSGIEWCILVGCFGMVLSAECLNTAIEKLADALHPDEHSLIGKAKDAAAAGVLILSITSAVIGTTILLPKLLSFFR